MKDLPETTRIEYYRHLLLLSEVNGEVPESEEKALAWYAAKWAVSETDALTSSAPGAWPSDPETAVAWLYDMCELSIADEVLSGTEKALLEKAAYALGFRSEAVMIILQRIVDGNRQGLEDEEVEERACKAALSYRS